MSATPNFIFSFYTTIANAAKNDEQVLFLFIAALSKVVLEIPS
ncbi:MAG: hypothetical protein ACK4HE_02925 [Chitinophagaceae bacterium]